MTTMPALFVSHGAPTFALEPGLAGAQLGALGRALGKPRGIVIVSPHWMTRGVEVGAAPQPATIHDFGGFPRALYQLSYPAPGSPALAARTAELLGAAGMGLTLDPERGLDHGAWVPLMHLYPEADVPVLQVSLPLGAGSAGAFALGRALAPLADEGVLVVGSGSLTHNLYEFRMGSDQGAPYAREFALWIRQAVRAGDRDRLLHALQQAPHADRAHPTDEHFLPLLVALGASPEGAPATVLDGGIRDGVLVMESYLFGREVELALAAPEVAA
ncbi:class III extradiol ring-cleavage dioxygenase [Ramlibacter tataouinensis]|uniref:dioxygenase family protein n=1 Tax=Ramlibacter tataouinensis TaxID=94132 RepID=UPI0022F3FE85|nr:class III extradiol ring-cleavage dioxygenase [Ramlibacter tataouinensis]WBY01350.1 class III extradiol ring-cleavage dioxygenase [Ramlibacter tataouinensis]